jgi:cold shock CspA family protein
MAYSLEGFEWRYGLENQEFIVGTVVEMDTDKGVGFGVCNNFNDRFLIREQEILFPCGPYRVATDEVQKKIGPGDVIQCPLIETIGGLIALGVRETGTLIEEPTYGKGPSSFGTAVWSDYEPFTRFIGHVVHYNFERAFGFIVCDSIENQVFFQRREIMVPYRMLADPHRAIKVAFEKKDTVTFDAIETPRGMRALAVKKWKPNRNKEE